MKKKLLALVLTAVMALSLTACGSSAKDTYTVGVCQLVQHVALDAATQGFKDALTEELGDKVVIDEQNASGEPANCATIVNGFISKKVDLMMANATPALQAAASATDTIPVLGTSITTYPVALDMDVDSFTGVIGNNISGTSDLAPLADQAAMIVEWFPNVKEVGIIYCSAEANSAYQVNVVTEELKKLGVNVTPFAFTDSNDITSVAQKACSTCEVLYVPTDNTVASNTEALANVVFAEGVPVFAGEEGICKGCGIASLSISYYDLGVTTGKMAAKILKGEAKVSEMAIEYAPAKKVYSAENCAKLGITAPAGYEAIAE